MNKKRMNKYDLLLKIGLLELIPLLSFIIVSFNSTYLITIPIRYIFILISVLSFASIAISCKMLKKIQYKYSKKNKVVSITFFSIYIASAIAVLIVLYSPYQGFRNWFITTAMRTQNHQYYCKWFYNDEQIQKVLDNNYIIEPDMDTDPSLVDPSIELTYTNKYEKSILENIKEDEKYRIIEFEIDGANAYLAAVYDPSMLKVGVTKDLGEKGQYVRDMASDKGAKLAINGGRFYDPDHSSSGGTPWGITVANYEIISGSSNTVTSVIGFNKDDVLVLLKNATIETVQLHNIRDAVSMDPFLIVNNEPAFISGNGGWGKAARTAIGQRADGIVLLLVVDTNEFRTTGADMGDLTEVMLNYGAINAANLDGGTSSVMVENYLEINDPIDSTLTHKTRPIATSFLLY